MNLKRKMERRDFQRFVKKEMLKLCITSLLYYTELRVSCCVAKCHTVNNHKHNLDNFIWKEPQIDGTQHVQSLRNSWRKVR